VTGWDFIKLLGGGALACWGWRTLDPGVQGRVKGFACDAIDALAQYVDAQRTQQAELERQVREAAALQALRPLEIGGPDQERREDHLTAPGGEDLLTREMIEAAILEFEAARVALDKRWRRVIRPPSVIMISGGRGSGKSALGYWLLELLRFASSAYAVGVPESAEPKLPKWIGIVPTLDDLPRDCTALIDEAYLLHHARESSTAAHRRLSAAVNLSRQRNQTLIFVSQESGQLDRSIVRSVDVLVIRKPGSFQKEFERRELSELIGRARDEIAAAPGDAHRWAFVHAAATGFTGLLEVVLPSFWTDEISTLFAGAAETSPISPPANLSRQEKIRAAKQMYGPSCSYRDIATAFGVAPGTAFNWVNDYPYRRRS